ncbi:Protein of unknown function [Gryllus bimaculatus]|nr:Protein of unknown function [Gryllus bimaculatus]
MKRWHLIRIRALLMCRSSRAVTVVSAQDLSVPPPLLPQVLPGLGPRGARPAVPVQRAGRRGGRAARAALRVVRAVDAAHARARLPLRRRLLPARPPAALLCAQLPGARRARERHLRRPCRQRHGAAGARAGAGVGRAAQAARARRRRRAALGGARGAAAAPRAPRARAPLAAAQLRRRQGQVPAAARHVEETYFSILL